MEYAVGPIIALLLGVGISSWKTKSYDDKVKSLEAKVEVVSKKVDAVDQVILPKVMQTLQPVTKAVVRINEEIGLQ